MRSFEQWWNQLPNDVKEKISINLKNPVLSQVTYVWLSNIMNQKNEEQNPTIEELFRWITDGQIDSRRN